VNTKRPVPGPTTEPPLCAGFHKAAVLCVSAAMRRPLLATASADNTVRVWDYQRMACATTFQASHPISTLAVHPWGTEMVISYRESAHTYVIANELIAGQRLEASNDGFSLCAYSPRGGMLACARKNTILLYVTNTYAHVATLKGHPESVVDLRWSDDGIQLVSACRAALYTWSMETYGKARASRCVCLFSVSARERVPCGALHVVHGDVRQGASLALPACASVNQRS
jgi:WD40 repeat protein